MKTYLVIGAGPGIGLVTAARFAREGYRVVLAARRADRLAALADALRGKGATVRIETVDARDSAQVASVVRSIGPDLAVLHYNAGVLHYDAEGRLQPRTLDDESVESLSADMTVNVTSALAAVREARALMAPRGAGTILLTGGGLGVEPSPAFLTLSVGKSALRAAAKSLFEPLRAQGVHIATVTVSTLVGPGSPQAEQVADTFWRLHDQAKDRWTWEAVYA